MDTPTIHAKLASHSIAQDWLVCPLGEADKAVTIGEFLEDTSVFNPFQSEAPGEKVAQTADSLETNNSKDLTLFDTGLITLLFSVLAKLLVYQIIVTQAKKGPNFEDLSSEFGFLSLCIELSTIGLWSGALLIVTHVVWTKTALAQTTSQK